MVQQQFILKKLCLKLIDSPAMTIWCSPDRMANDFEKQTKGVTDYLQRHGIHMDADDPWPGDNW